jgi:hypothetical protein
VVYDPKPAEEPLRGTVKGIGIEVGIKARLLCRAKFWSARNTTNMLTPSNA